ncbi:hypothetical protein ACIBG8_30655 [Nonomuraea sp. NPDC050556]|uniref:hypothetical protein n=1 Tax=Nonomuraea sp. NPDC050556 TaxID=3364369 RepID=UPI00378E55DB
MNDDFLLAAIRLAAGSDPIPPDVTAAARDLYALRLPNAVTASPVECSATRGVRDEQGSRLASFEAAGLAFELEVTVSDGLIDVAGQVSPHPGAGSQVTIRTPHVSMTRELGVGGQFAATGLPPGWFSVICHRPGRDPVVTRWVRIRP